MMFVFELVVFRKNLKMSQECCHRSNDVFYYDDTFAVFSYTTLNCTDYNGYSVISDFFAKKWQK